jgi:sarcosine/dimethylglycine N-methyltransferase
MSTEIRSAIDFYERHPISAKIILAKLIASRGHLNGVAPEPVSISCRYSTASI